MKKTTALLFALLVIVACSKDQSDNSPEANYGISGKFVTPNGTDAVSKAHVKLYKNNDLIQESLTDSEGNFSLDGLTKDDYELTISKGAFRTSTTVDLNDLIDAFTFNFDSIPIAELPNIAVVTGSFDHIEEVLYNIGLVNPITQEPLFDIIDGHDTMDRNPDTSHRRHHDMANRTFNPMLQPNVDFGFGDLIESPTLLSNYDIIFLNCGLSESKVEFGNNLTAYVSNGGLLYATDWAYSYLDDITAGGTNYLSFYDPYRSGSSLSTEAEILNQDLIDWISLNFGIDIPNGNVTINEFLGGWQVVDSFDNTTVIPWLYGPVEYDGISESKYLAYTFLHGDGGVMYSSFHTENNTSDATTVERLMQYMVFELAAME
ncbi:carboxypeptidase-like regulatory domain-containing protein [Winogradskyella flava]|uniref:Carboxypeptidase regulatory-like domain-containing protein n=1 Tax=Winogradskyella flava TaxID=1884876 RepID=A0A842ITV7_9FLAO|nr:carboxypeptidase-like regulatory domain-containing protein [Winogradskyella flava]MBC2845206.1 carboxypeptidase regulatory-like domain-containing protein [Winogradskyella flava]